MNFIAFAKSSAQEYARFKVSYTCYTDFLSTCNMGMCCSFSVLHLLNTVDLVIERILALFHI